MSNSNPITAAELMEQLQSDPAYQVKMKQQRQAQIDANKQYQADVAPILHELGELGIDTDLYDLAQYHAPLSEEIVQLLLKWLPKTEDDRVLEGIVRSLGVPEIPYDGTALIEAFEQTDSDTLRWVIANTIAEAQPANVGDWLTDAVQKSSYGKAREMLILAVARIIDSQSAISVLKQYANEFPGFVAKAFSECGDRSLINFLDDLKSDSNSWEQKEIARAITILSKSK